MTKRVDQSDDSKRMEKLSGEIRRLGGVFGTVATQTLAQSGYRKPPSVFCRYPDHCESKRRHTTQNAPKRLYQICLSAEPCNQQTHSRKEATL